MSSIKETAKTAAVRAPFSFLSLNQSLIQGRRRSASNWTLYPRSSPQQNEKEQCQSWAEALLSLPHPSIHLSIGWIRPPSILFRGMVGWRFEWAVFPPLYFFHFRVMADGRKRERERELFWLSAHSAYLIGGCVCEREKEKETLYSETKATNFFFPSFGAADRAPQIKCKPS